MVTVTLDPAGFPTLKYSGYALRDVGPAGGWVFYDKGSYSDGWRYLEAAPAVTEMNDLRWMEGAYNYIIGAVFTFYFGGVGNTLRMVSIIPNSLTTIDIYSEAAHCCLSLRWGGAADWYLPSQDELNAMYTNLHFYGVGGFAADYYWSSSEYNATDAWGQSFGNGTQNYLSKDNDFRVRAVRAF
jgi:hypothetical protein